MREKLKLLSFLDDNSGVKRFIALLFLLQSTLLYAETEVQRVDGQPVEAPHRDTFAELMRIPEVEQQYQTCIDNGVETQNLDQCLWEGFTGGGVTVPDPGDEYRQRVQEGLRVQSISRGFDEPEDAPAQTSREFSLANAAIENLKERQDPAYKELQNYLELRLRTALYGEVQGDISGAIGGARAKDSPYQHVDQSTFFRLYESQLTQNIIQTLSNYCIRTQKNFTPSTPRVADKLTSISYNDSQTVIEQNLEELQNLDLAKAHWKLCLNSLNESCYPKTTTPSLTDYDPTNPGQREACLTLRSIRASRQALIHAVKLRTRLTTPPCEDITAETSPATGTSNGRIQKPNRSGMSCVTLFAQAGNTRQYDSNNKDSGIDRLTTITSGDLHHNESNYASANEDLLKKFREDCLAGGAIDIEKCKSYVETDLEEQKKQLAELSLRGHALQARIKEAAGDPDKVKEILKEEGYGLEKQNDQGSEKYVYDESVIDDLIEQAQINGEDIATVINRHYDFQRRSLVDKLASNIKERTIDPTGSFAPGSQNEINLKRIEQELVSRVDSFTRLLHYNNIMAGFLAIGEGSNQRLNSQLIERELANSYFNPQTTDPSRSPSGYNYDNVVSQIEADQALQNNSSSVESTVNLEVDQINENFLRYFEFQKPTNPVTTP